MYKEGEKLEVLDDIKNIKKEVVIVKGTIVKFVRAHDHSFTRSLVQVEYENNIYILNELAVRSIERDPLEALKAFNNALIKSNPDLGIYHHNLFIRSYNRFKAWIKSIFTKKKVKAESVKMKDSDIKFLKSIINTEESE